MTVSSSTVPAGQGWRLARLTTPLARRFAGRRFFPLWAVVHHRGRRTGRALSVPVAVQATPSAFVVTLPWGERTNWAQNVLAADGCVVRWRGTDHQVRSPRLLDRPTAKPYFGRWEWWAVEHAIGATSFLLLPREPEKR